MIFEGYAYMPIKLEKKLDKELSENPKYKHLSEDRKHAIKHSVIRYWRPEREKGSSGAEISPVPKKDIDYPPENHPEFEELFKFALQNI